MPFDGTGFPPRSNRPKSPPANNNFVTALIIGLAILLLGMPISIAGLIDILHAMTGS